MLVAAAPSPIPPPATVLVPTREQWLQSAVDHLRPVFLAQGVAVPPAVHVSMGFPSTGALARRSRRIGECWPPEASRDGLHHLFLSPLLAEPLPVLAILVHELVHAAVGLRARHGPPFRRLALALGLRGRMTSTTAGPELAARLAELAAGLGAFPHAGLLANPARSKQTTRLRKVACPACGYTVRVTAKWIAAGLPICPCGNAMWLNGLAD
ncbi:MAG TPA: transcription elongation protein SprT [Thermoanaerobaculia bacterium]